jgi:succinate dehydrogenase flavin-adding protein (antitoxin of CptAB toxin-antitoxin module)
MGEIDLLKKKILYLSTYRGTKELDILISKFVRKIINDLNLEDLKELKNFLNIDDQEIYDFYFSDIEIKNFTNSKILKLFKDFKI